MSSLNACSAEQHHTPDKDDFLIACLGPLFDAFVPIALPHHTASKNRPKRNADRYWPDVMMGEVFARAKSQIIGLPCRMPPSAHLMKCSANARPGSVTTSSNFCANCTSGALNILKRRSRRAPATAWKLSTSPGSSGLAAALFA